MASPGQRQGNCGHKMVGYDLHERCARSRDKKLGSDPCVKNNPCTICDSLTDQQKFMLSTPQYQIRKDKKSGLLVSPSKVTVVGVVDLNTGLDEDAPANVSTGSGQQELFTVSHHTADEFVSKHDFDLMSNQLEEKFARFEALLTRTNIFSTPKVLVSTATAPVSTQPFFNPSDPGRTIFSWSHSEARLNSQFSRVAKVSSYPQSSPDSRPVPQDILHRWEKCAREETYVTNHTAGFNRCTSEIQDKMNTHINLLNDVIVKGKAPKEVVEAIKDLKDLSSFHSSISVALGTALQHLADSLFVQLANFILLRRDSYLEFMKPGVKADSYVE